jgi:DNA-binding transcriptional MerR regulator
MTLPHESNKNKNPLKVGAVAKATGVGVQTLHYYERLGLLPKPERSAANYRLYSAETVRRIRFIKKAQALGLTLEETKQILDLKAHGRAPCHQVVELGKKHLQEVDARLARLRTFRCILVKSLEAWRRKDRPGRACAGEFCDLIERLP